MAKKSESLSKSYRHEWVGLMTLFGGIFIAAGLINVQWTGLIGKWIVHYGAVSLLGRAVFVLPILVASIGISLIIGVKKWRRIVISGIGIGISAAVLIEMIVFKSPHDFLSEGSRLGGGLLGWALYSGSYTLFGNIGTGLWCAGTLLIGIAVWFEYSLLSPFRAVRDFFSKGVNNSDDTLPLQSGGLLGARRYGLRGLKAQVNSEPRIIEFDPVPPIPEVGDENDNDNHRVEAVVPEAAIKKPAKAPQLVLEADSADYQFPPIELLDPGVPSALFSKENVKRRQDQAKTLEEALLSFQVTAKVVNISPGPSVTRFELEPGVGVKVAKITALAKDLALKLATPDVRIEAPIPGKALVGIEVPNTQTDTVTLRGLLEKTDFYRHPSKLLSGIGLTITGDATLMDLAKMPHVLIAGATGSGKSVCVNVLILSILLRAKPDEVKFLMIDPKKVELSLYEGIPHLLAPVVTDPHKAAATLNKWALVEMEKRYEVFSKVGVKNIEGFNQWVAEQEALKSKGNVDGEGPDEQVILQRYPYIVVIIDELADLMMVASQEVENTICRLAQMSRATGIHLVIATQRPSVDVVTGLIKANVPSRISFFLQSQIDSRTILDMAGAEKLLGKGDMLYSPVGSFKPSRVQGVYVSEKEVKTIVKFLKAQGAPTYVDAILDVEPLPAKGESASPEQDELFEEAKQIVMSTQYASTSYLQRKLRIGYNRAARLMEELESSGIVSHYAAERRRTP